MRVLLVIIAVLACIKVYTPPYGDTAITLSAPWAPTFDGARPECARDLSHASVLFCGGVAKARQSAGVTLFEIGRCDWCEDLGVWIAGAGRDADEQAARMAAVNRAIAQMN